MESSPPSTPRTSSISNANESSMLQHSIRKSGIPGDPSDKEMEKGIYVLCRIRPFNDMEDPKSACVEVDTQAASVEVPSISESFCYDSALGPDCSQAQVYDLAAKDVVADFMSGINGTIFAYGQTGSGKTHTMEGKLEGPDSSGRGLVPRVIAGIFDHIEESSDMMQFDIKVSYIEIYNEKVRCLLSSDKTALKVRQRSNGEHFVEGAAEFGIQSEADVLKVLAFGATNRAIGSTNMNQDSSRSHSIFMMHMVQTNALDGSKKMSKLNMVDLAGSESVGKSGASGERLDEAKSINRSLTSLTSVIFKLSEPGLKSNDHIPYRDSKLTLVLRDALGGNCRTSLIVCASPSTRNTHETVSTLRFGRRAKAIKNKAKVNVEPSPLELKAQLAKLQAKNRELYGEVQSLREENASMLDGKDGKDGAMQTIADLRRQLTIEREAREVAEKEAREREESLQEQVDDLAGSLEEAKNSLGQMQVPASATAGVSKEREAELEGLIEESRAKYAELLATCTDEYTKARLLQVEESNILLRRKAVEDQRLLEAKSLEIQIYERKVIQKGQRISILEMLLHDSKSRVDRLRGALVAAGGGDPGANGGASAGDASRRVIHGSRPIYGGKPGNTARVKELQDMMVSSDKSPVTAVKDFIFKITGQRAE